MAQEPVFRFLALRQPRRKSAAGKKGSKVVDFAVTGKLPPVAQQTTAIPRQRRTEEAVAAVAREARASDRYVGELDGLPLNVAPLAEWAARNGRTPLQELDLAAFVKDAYGQTPAKLVESEAFQDTAERLAESIYADTLLPSDEEAPGRDAIPRAIKLLHLVREVADDAAALDGDEPLNEHLARMVVAIPDPEIERPAPEDPPMLPRTPAEDEETKKRREELRRLIEARDELEAAMERPGALEAQPAAAEGGGAPLATATRSAAGAAEAPSAMSVRRPRLVLSRTVAEGLSAHTRSALSSMNLEAQDTHPQAALAALDRQIARVSRSLPAPRAASKVLAFAGLTIDRDRFMKSRSNALGKLDGNNVKQQHRKFEAGVGDLLVVRQKLKAYELGDFAHVENVMMGEQREREHRRLSVREETTTFETTRETHLDRDLQTTDKSEMAKESALAVKSHFGLESGTEISAAYGPITKMSASMKVGFTTDVEASQKKAIKYSRDVTDKITEKLHEKIREERKLIVREETEEKNRHEFDNSAAQKHLRGIYRWLNKVYDAQVYNYGQRMMYEFVVPEPAAYFLWTMIAGANDANVLEEPQPPELEDGTPLQARHLDEETYHDYLTQYEVTSAKAPPPKSINVAWFVSKDAAKQGEESAGDAQRASKVEIPDGYEAVRATAEYHGVYGPKNATIFTLVGGRQVGGGWTDIKPPIGKEISVGLFTFGFSSFMATIDIECARTLQAFEQWQLETFDAIMEAYQRQKAAYEDKLAQLEIQKGPLILGRNPLENRRIAHDELKKLVIMLFVGQPSIHTNMYTGGQDGPVLNLKNTFHLAPQIRFFENCFEWTNMTYVFYPYFWGRKAGWDDALRLSDADPDFAAFLRAGAARVQVPVRPGFEKAVAYFAKTKQVWNGNDAPVIGDELYVAIIDEITENLGKLNEDTPYDPASKPWEVIVPTNLVMVQDPDEIKGIRDSLTGEDVQP